MRLNSIIFTIILVVWMGASTYWYVCKIKQNCDKPKISSVVTLNTTEIQKEISEIAIKNTEQKTEKEKVDIINSVKEKLSKGYTVYNFPKNSDVNNNIEDEFNEFASDLKLYLQENIDSKIKITGYADNSGSKRTNLFYGKKRAIFIKSKLINEGIDEKFFIIKSMGEANPITSNKTKEGQLKNRRVIIKLTDK